MRCDRAGPHWAWPPSASPAARASQSSWSGRESTFAAGGDPMSVHAVVLIECEIDEIPEAAQAIADLEGVSEVEGVARTETLIAFQVYSKHDLERLFSIGFDETPS